MVEPYTSGDCEDIFKFWVELEIDLTNSLEVCASSHIKASVQILGQLFLHASLLGITKMQAWSLHGSKYYIEDWVIPRVLQISEGETREFPCAKTCVWQPARGARCQEF